MKLTAKIIFEKCKKFEVGDKIYIHRKERGGNSEPAVHLKVPATVIARYDNYLLTERAHGIKECFTYTEIVTTNVITKRVGRPRKAIS